MVSIHARRVTGDVLGCTAATAIEVSIHARRVTGDKIARRVRGTGQGFNSRPSCDGRPRQRARLPCRRCFNSRPSCDGRHARFLPVPSTWRFNSRPSCDGRLMPRRLSLSSSVSIHARRVTGDFWPLRVARRIWCFNSRPSCDGRLYRVPPEVNKNVSIHARRVTGDIM